MKGKPKVFLDTSALFSAVYSETGGARMILKLGEAGAVHLWVGPWVLKEAEAVIERKSPDSKAYFVLLLDRSGVAIGREANEEELAETQAIITYPPDAQIVAEVLAEHVDYFVSFDREHLLGNPDTERLPFLMGTAGDFLAWYRRLLVEESDTASDQQRSRESGQ